MRIRGLAIVFLLAAARAHAQAGGGDCFSTNLDPATNLLTIVDAQPGLVNQQCFITVVPKDAAPPLPRRHVLREGTYLISVSAGGGGGGGGSSAGGGAGGQGGAVDQVKTHLMPGTYRVTIGTGGSGGGGCGTAGAARARAGNPSSVSDAYTGQTIAGTPRAEYASGSAPVEPSFASSDEGGEPVVSSIEGGMHIRTPVPGEGGAGGSLRGDGAGRDGTPLAVLSGLPGRGGEPDRIRLAGGGGGAGFGRGGDGASPAAGSRATPGELGGGGGGGHGGRDCSDGAPGGHGFIGIVPAS